MAIAKDTVLVLGAGASSSYGFPLGVGLRDQIADLTTQPRFQYRVAEFGYGPTVVKDLGEAVRHSGYRTIDALLEAMPEFVPLGKLAIALALLPLEEHKALFPPKVKSNSHWYELLANRLDIGKVSWRENKLTIATFNYDRSFEHYLATVIAQRERVSLSRAARKAAKIKIIHLHGQLGAHPGFGVDPVGYGDYKPEALVRAAAGIRVISEGDNLSTFKKVGAAINRANHVFFLGFGYSQQSMARLHKFSDGTTARFSGTSKGLTEAEWYSTIQSFFARKWYPRRYRSSVYDFLRAVGA